MADITLTYKGDTIAELSESGSKTIETAGKYCEADILLDYVRPEGGDDVDPIPDLPSGYTKVNCVSIPMGGYVNTGVNPTIATSEYYMDARMDTPISSLQTAGMYFGSKASTHVLAYVGNFTSYNGVVFQLMSLAYTEVGQKSNSRVVIKSGLAMVKNSVDDTQAYFAPSWATTNNNRPVLLAARQNENGTGIERNCALTVWRYVHKKEGIKQIDLIPCKQNSNNEFGFYDTVSGAFFGNSGSGTFTEGVE